MMGVLEDSPHVSITKVSISQDGAIFWHPLGISKQSTMSRRHTKPPRFRYRSSQVSSDKGDMASAG